MSADDVRATLAEERKIINKMMDCLNQIDKSTLAQREARYILESWKRFLCERRGAGEDLEKMNDTDLFDDLTREGEQIDEYIKITPPTSKPQLAYREEWKNFLVCEYDIIERLKTLYKQP